MHQIELSTIKKYQKGAIETGERDMGIVGTLALEALDNQASVITSSLVHQKHPNTSFELSSTVVFLFLLPGFSRFSPFF